MTPLLLATLAYAAGLLGGLRAPLPLPFGLALIAFGALLLQTGRRRGLAVLFCTAGLLVGGLRREAVLADCRQHLGDGARLRITGVPKVLPTEGVATPFIAALAEDDGEGTPCTGIVRARAPARVLPALDSAAHGLIPPVLARGRWLGWPAHGGWPRRAEFAGTLLIDAVEPIRAAPPAAAPRTGPADRFRAAQQARLRALLPERWGLAEALLLAQRSGLAPETRARWVAAGLVHLLAISGMHVGLIAAGVLAVASAAGVGPRSARRIAVLVTACYVIFLGAPSAALRALLQATLLLASVELQRPAEPFTALACAALAILLLEPMAVLDPGFQLSFAGMVGLIGWRRPVADLLPQRLHRYLRDGIAAGVAASALTTPIAALHFGTASWIGVPASLLAVPVMGVAVAALLLALLVAALTGITQGPHALAADVPLRLLDFTAELAARVPGGHGYVSSFTVMACLIAAAAALFVRRALTGDAQLPPPSHAPAHVHERWSRRHRARRFRVAAAAAAAVAAIAWTPLVLQSRDGAVEIHAIDVGQGDAFAIRTPANRWILVDAGPRTPRFDAGRDRVAPYLLKHGVRRIEVMILTHPDADHIGGAAAVMDAFDVGTVIDPGFAAGKDLFIDLLSAARRGDTRWVAAREGISLHVDGVQLSFLFPLSSLDAAADANDTSVVFRLVFGAFTALFLGDASASVEERLADRHGDGLRTTLLKVGHHGSTTSTGEVLLRTIRPHAAVVSAGRNNRYGHPAPAVLRRLAEHEVRVLRTDLLGNITIRASRTGSMLVLAR